MIDQKARITPSAIVEHGAYEYSVQLANGLRYNDNAQLVDFVATGDDITQASDDFAKAMATSDGLIQVKTRASKSKRVRLRLWNIAITQRIDCYGSISGNGCAGMAGAGDWRIFLTAKPVGAASANSSLLNR